jgi:HIRAN domain
MPDERRRVTLTKVQCESPVGRDLIALLTELSSDGVVSRDELQRLRAWLEVDRGVEFPALAFLYEVIEQISSDGEITEEELDQLALAIERVLPKDVRDLAAAKRKKAQEARRTAQRETTRQIMFAQRMEKRAVRAAAQARAGVLYQADFAVRGAFRFAERREGCERLIVGDVVTLEREVDNVHDVNAILVLGGGDCELGYVPREEARAMAPLLDAGAEAEARIHRLWETPEGQIVPILLVKVRRGDATESVAAERKTPSRSEAKPTGAGCATALVLVGLALVLLALR